MHNVNTSHVHFSILLVSFDGKQILDILDIRLFVQQLFDVIWGF